MTRTTRSRPPKTAPPATAEEGAGRVLTAAIQLFDRKDGTGAPWQIMAEAIFRAGFSACAKLDEEPRRRLLARIHAAAYERLSATGGDDSMTHAPDAKASPAAAFNAAPTVRGPK